MIFAPRQVSHLTQVNEAEGDPFWKTQLTFDHNERPLMPTRGTMDESGQYVTLDNATDDRKTISMNGSGFIEMLARQMTADLQAEAALTPIGASTPLTSKGVSFGTLIHKADGTWDTSKVEGLVAPSLSTPGEQRRLPAAVQQ